MGRARGPQGARGVGRRDGSSELLIDRGDRRDVNQRREKAGKV